MEKEQPIALPQALRFTTYAEFRSFQGSNADHSAKIAVFEAMIISSDIFSVAARCELCDREANFHGEE